MRGKKAKAERKAGTRKGPEVRDKSKVDHSIPWTEKELAWKEKKNA